MSDGQLQNLPAYHQLPVREGAPAGSAWGVFGDDDQVGTVNLLTPDVVRHAAGLVRQGRVFALNAPVDLLNPPLYGRGAPRHTLVEGQNSRDDYLDNFWPQASSQWDGLRHIRHPRDGFYNGTPDQDVSREPGSRLGIEHWARRGIAGRGVLLDVARFLRERGQPLDPLSSTPIPVETLEEVARWEGVEFRRGDILLLHYGWLSFYMEAPTEVRERLARELRAPGIQPGKGTAAWLWDHHVAAIASDGPSTEPWPPTPELGFLHFQLIPLLGMPIGELWYLSELAEDCARDGVYEFLLTSAPLHVPGGVGSPPNALAIK
ncbi:MAG TPA: cyclase family protein [Dehalococcoidia bacterium]